MLYELIRFFRREKVTTEQALEAANRNFHSDPKVSGVRHLGEEFASLCQIGLRRA